MRRHQADPFVGPVLSAHDAHVRGIESHLKLRQLVGLLKRWNISLSQEVKFVGKSF